ncbi:tubulin-folding cofactor B-like, partial [Malurus melanocephalus]|uniref:tubulin-folding cofactor B-like n=1 Tax=Malurus melanocephalus TaxID=175006 RepID=UPI0025487D71
MDLELFGAEDEPLGPLDRDEALLGSYPVSDGCRLHSAVGPFCHLGHLPVTSIVTSIVTSVTRCTSVTSIVLPRNSCRLHSSQCPLNVPTESMRSFLRQRSWGRWDQDREREREREREQRRAQEAAAAASLPVGARCEVRVPGQPCRRATIAFVGAFVTLLSPFVTH